MLLTKDTTIHFLTSEYPFLIESLALHNSSFEKLKNPLLRQTVGRLATIEKAASMGDESVLSLLLFIAGEIMAQTGQPVEISPPEVRQAQPSGKISREQRLVMLKEIIKELHDGVEFATLQEKFNKTVGDISPEEIASLEQTLVNEGMPETEIKKMCHLHAALFQNALEGQAMPQVAPGHPVDTYLKENTQAKKLTAEIKDALGLVSGDDGEKSWPFTVGRLQALTQDLADIQTHYVRKENQLFPLLEQHDLSAPGKVMWEVHDDIRRLFRRAQDLFAAGDRNSITEALKELVDEVDEMFRKEENILFPMSLQLLTDADWARCRQGDDEIGYSFGIVPDGQWAAPEPSGGYAKAEQTGLVDLSTGQLPPEVVDAILCNLPVDISFVGADDRVAYYSDSAHRIFPRSAAVIGREVKNCHPSKSVHMVTEIMEAFKKGERDKAEFWLELGGKFIHIQYMALRSRQGEYLGCLEVGQDATYLRSLTGQRRLLEWT